MKISLVEQTHIIVSVVNEVSMIMNQYTILKPLEGQI